MFRPVRLGARSVASGATEACYRRINSYVSAHRLSSRSCDCLSRRIAICGGTRRTAGGIVARRWKDHPFAKSEAASAAKCIVFAGRLRRMPDASARHAERDDVFGAGSGGRKNRSAERHWLTKSRSFEGQRLAFPARLRSPPFHDGCPGARADRAKFRS